MRALISVSDKRGIADFASDLAALGVELISTGFPEILDGRVKTLHPRVHGGVLARGDEAHGAELETHGIDRFDLVVVNLYPFRETVARPDVSAEEALEQIDIGGPTLLRAAAKNHPQVLVLVDPEDYAAAHDALAAGDVPAALRRSLARKAFAHTAGYDAAIVAWFDRDGEDAGALPPTLHLTLERGEVLRYGENPHQRGARYREVGAAGAWDAVTQRKGVALSYLNLFDADAAWRLVHEFEMPAAVVVKHANPCGVARDAELATAYERALACDPKSAFGGIVALNRVCDAATAERIMDAPKCDVLVAPGYEPAALEVLNRKRKNMRVLEMPAPSPARPDLRRVDGGFLVQEADRLVAPPEAWTVATERAPSEDEWRDLRMAWTVCAYTKSNAIVLVADGQAVGIGAGQQSRVDAGEIAARKADGRARGGAAASDAFYPFRDGLDAAAAAGATAVVQPGGSIRDDEVIAAANEHGIAMVLTGERHFRH